jgi:hypothetical protein
MRNPMTGSKKRRNPRIDDADLQRNSLTCPAGELGLVVPNAMGKIEEFE